MTPRRDAIGCGEFARLCVLVIAAGLIGAGGSLGSRQAPRSFAARIAALSEPGRYFDTDNLISNERSYLQVLPDLQRARLRGGVYVGVGPDQNFSYVAAIRPAVAFIIDIRRDNLLLHLLFKALFELSRTRIEYLAMLFGRPVPANLDDWRRASVDRLADYVDSTSRAQSIDATRKRVDSMIRRYGVPLSHEDLATIDRFHRRFIDAGLALRFHSMGRPPQSYYPSYRQLLLETDPAGRRANFLASEDSFQFLKSLQVRDLIVPVVGDLAGPSAMMAIGRFLTERGERLSAFYVSNVELYLFRDGAFPRYVKNLADIPRAQNALLIRSVFGRYAMGPDGGSTSHVQPVDELVAGFSSGRFQRYDELLARR